MRLIGKPIAIPYNGSVVPIRPNPVSVIAVGRELEAFGADVVHVHEPFAPSTSMYAVLRSRAPLVATFHAYAEGSRLLGAARPALRPLWRRLDRRIAVSRAAAGFVASYFGEDGLTVIPNGVDTEVFARATPADLPAGRRVLFVNRLEPRKGFSVALRAFGLLLESVPDALLVVAGDGRERGAVAELPDGVRSRVIQLGHVGHDALPSFHAACDVFVAPASGGESFGIVLVEAMSAGLPVAASDIAGYREVVRDGVEGLLVPPSDVGALAGALERLLVDEDLRHALGEAGRARSLEYSWDRIVGRIEAVYVDATRG